VGAENHSRIPGERENVEAIGYEELSLDTVSAVVKQLGQEQPNFFLTAGDRGNGHQLLCKFKHIEALSCHNPLAWALEHIRLLSKT
jgi:hypothetical protein